MPTYAYTTVLRCLSLFGLLIFLVTVQPGMETPVNAETNAKEAIMSQAIAQRTESIAIPPLDRDAPAVYETASFGLG